jgi:glycosyltransferase involved in cell wall biosynthesis
MVSCVRRTRGPRWSRFENIRLSALPSRTADVAFTVNEPGTAAVFELRELWASRELLLLFVWRDVRVRPAARCYPTCRFGTDPLMTRAIAWESLIDGGVSLRGGEPHPRVGAASRERVLHTFWKLERGGAQLRTLEVLQALGGRSPVETHILIQSGEAGDLDDAFRRAGAALHHARLTAANFAPRFLALLWRERIDTIHSHLQYFSGWLLMLGAIAGVRKRIAHLWITNNPSTHSPFRHLHRGIGRRLLRRYATRILAVSRDTMAAAFDPQWERDPRCRVVYGGIPGARCTSAQLEAMRRDARAEFQFDESALVVIHAGRFDEAKNHSRIVAVFAALARRAPAARLLLAGRGDDAIERRVREQVRQLGLEDRVTFTGSRCDVLRLLAGADVLLFPSTREGLPGTVLESLSVGTPCVASAIAGTREVAQFSTAIELLGLDADDATWASRVEAAASDRSLVARVERMHAFSATPFNIDTAAAALAAEWTSP